MATCKSSVAEPVVSNLLCDDLKVFITICRVKISGISARNNTGKETFAEKGNTSLICFISGRNIKSACPKCRTAEMTEAGAGVLVFNLEKHVGNLLVLPERASKTGGSDIPRYSSAPGVGGKDPSVVKEEVNEDTRRKGRIAERIRGIQGIKGDFRVVRGHFGGGKSEIWGEGKSPFILAKAKPGIPANLSPT